MHGLEAKYYEQVEFIYLDIDDPNTQPFKEQLGYRYQPHIFLLNEQGEIVEQWIGLVGQAELEEALQRLAQ